MHRLDNNCISAGAELHSHNWKVTVSDTFSHLKGAIQLLQTSQEVFYFRFSTCARSQEALRQ